jgi:hypothetical protein
MSDPRPRRQWAAGFWAREMVSALPGTMITLNYRDACRKVHMIMETVAVCPIFGGDFSLGDEFSVYVTGVFKGLSQHGLVRGV